jgi:hypothetical protein
MTFDELFAEFTLTPEERRARYTPPPGTKHRM